MLGLQYNIIEDLKIICGNISMYDLLQMYLMPNGPILNTTMSSLTQNTRGITSANSNSNSDLISKDKENQQLIKPH